MAKKKTWKRWTTNQKVLLTFTHRRLLNNNNNNTRIDTHTHNICESGVGVGLVLGEGWLAGGALTLTNAPFFYVCEVRAEVAEVVVVVCCYCSSRLVISYVSTRGGLCGWALWIYRWRFAPLPPRGWVAADAGALVGITRSHFDFFFPEWGGIDYNGLEMNYFEIVSCVCVFVFVWVKYLKENKTNKKLLIELVYKYIFVGIYLVVVVEVVSSTRW